MVYPNSSNAADLIFTHGNIITMDDALPRAEAIAVKGGKVVYVGTSQKVMELAGEHSEVIDLGLWAYPNEEDESQIEFLKKQYRFDPERLIAIADMQVAGDFTRTGSIQTGKEADLVVIDQDILSVPILILLEVFMLV